MAHHLAEIVGAVAQFIGVSLMALITVSTARIVFDLLGPKGAERVRDARIKADRAALDAETQSPKEGL